jgi:hypothetical protein
VSLFANEARHHATGDANEVSAISESVVVTLRRHGETVTAEVEAPTDDLALRRGPGPTSVGDDSFERLVSASGGVASLVRLDAEARSLAIPLVAVGMRLSERRAVLPYATPSRTRSLVDLMEHLSRPRTLTECATSNIRSDPAPGVRLMSLSALLAQRGKILEAQPATQLALQDSDQSVRLLAALAMPPMRDAVLAMNPPRLVAEILTRMPSPCAAMAIRYLGSCGHPAEPHLLAALEVPELVAARDTRPALLDALQAAGTAASIEAMKRHGFSIAAKGIQERLPNAGTGQVTIAGGDEAGSLSIAEPPGALSMAKKQPT